MEKKYIKNLNIRELGEFFVENGSKKYRAQQVFDDIYIKRVSSFSEVNNLPASDRDLLDSNFYLNTIKSGIFQQSSDGTKKFLFELFDGKSIESVLIPNESDSDDENRRNTLCVSTQIGCSVGCAFCATGKLKLSRDLEASEIIDQVFMAEKLSGLKISNIVFMGMGEPFLNYENSLHAVKILTDPKYGILGGKRITVSTSGLVPQIYKLAKEELNIKLAISLHATTNGLRNKLIPISRKFDLKSLFEAVEHYYRKTKNPITYEYIPFAGLNDTDEDVKRLAKICRRVPSKVNIIPFHDIGFTNPTGFAAELRASSNETILEFIKKLKVAGVNVFKRSSSGLDIDAACGQLAYSKRNNSNK